MIAGILVGSWPDFRNLWNGRTLGHQISTFIASLDIPLVELSFPLWDLTHGRKGLLIGDRGRRWQHHKFAAIIGLAADFGADFWPAAASPPLTTTSTVYLGIGSIDLDLLPAKTGYRPSSVSPLFPAACTHCRYIFGTKISALLIIISCLDLVRSFWETLFGNFRFWSPMLVDLGFLDYPR